MPTHDDTLAMLDSISFSSQHIRFAAWDVLALAGLGPDEPWSAAANPSLTVQDGIMRHIKERFGKEYRDGTRESFRKALRDLEAAGLVVRNLGDSSVATHSKNSNWTLSPRFASAIKHRGDAHAWQKAVAKLEGLHAPTTLRGAAQVGQAVLDLQGRPMQLPNGAPFLVSSDRHGTLVKHIIEHLLPTLSSKGARLVYADPGASLPRFVDLEGLGKGGIEQPPSENRPDVIAVDAEGQVWFVESVESSGHFTEERRTTRMALLRGRRPAAFVTAYESRRQARQPLNTFAPGTHVWYATEPQRGLYTL